MKFDNITNNILGHPINDLYGSEEKSNKTPIHIGIFFAVFFSALLVIFNSSKNAEQSLKIFLIYFILVSFSLSFFAFSSYFFQKKKNMNKFVNFKKSMFILSFLLILVAIFPITLFSIVSEKIKFNSFFKHMDIYFITLFVPLLISILVVPYVFFHCNFLSALNLNYMTIFALLIFITYQGLTSLFLYGFHKIVKNKLSDIEYKSIKKDFNVLVFAGITTMTFVANCFVFSDIENEFINGFTSAFAIYIAYDRLKGKWKTLNQQFEQDSKQDSI